MGYPSLYCIQDKIDSVLTQFSEDDIRLALIKCYEQFYVLDESANWALPQLQTHRDFLIPKKDLLNEIKTFCLQITCSIEQNEYLMDFFETIDFERPIEISSVSDEEEIQCLYYILFGFSLDRFNRLLRDDVDLLEETVSHFQKTRFKLGFYRLTNILAIIKLHSIQRPVTEFIKQRKQGKINKNFGKFILSFNIFEATLVDLCTAHLRNALSSLPLIFFSPNFKGLFGVMKNFKRGAHSRFSPDAKAVEMYSPEQKKWSDLYQSWNMAFVAQFPEGLYLNMKLFIPSVAQYESNSGEYMHNRITALLLAMNYIDFASHYPRIPIKIKNIKTFPKTLTQLWGRINYRNAIKYFKSLKK